MSSGPATDAHSAAAAHGATGRLPTAATLLTVLGVVYGDIGTSPLYALKTSLLHFAAEGIERADVLGILSIIFWSLILVVTVKYVLLIMRADNRGEGGIMALTALAQRVLANNRVRWAAEADYRAEGADGQCPIHHRHIDLALLVTCGVQHPHPRQEAELDCLLGQ